MILLVIVGLFFLAGTIFGIGAVLYVLRDLRVTDTRKVINGH